MVWQAGRQAGKQAGGQAGRHAGRQAGREAVLLQTQVDVALVHLVNDSSIDVRC